MRGMRNDWPRSILVLLGVVGLVGLPAMPVTRTASAQGPVKVGLIYAETGPLAQVGLDLRDGFLLYWSEVGNRAGGRPVEVLLEGNSSNKVDEGLTKARKLVEREQVHVLGGIVETPIAYALRPFVIDKKVPFVIMNAGADGLTQGQRSAYVFRSSFSNSDSSHPLGEWAHKQGYRKAVIMASDFGAGYEHIGGFARTFLEAGGQVIQEIYPALGTPDFAPFLSQIRRDADVVAVFFPGADAVRFVNQYAEFGLRGRIPLIGKGFLVEEVLLPALTDRAVGIASSLHWSAALETPANKRFVEAYAAKYKRPPSSASEQGHLGAQMIARALEAVTGNIETQQAFLTALARVDIDAPRGKVRLDAYHNPIHNIYIRKVEKKGNEYVNTVIATYPSVSQFWRWTPEAYLAMPAYADMKGKWVK